MRLPETVGGTAGEGYISLSILGGAQNGTPAVKLGVEGSAVRERQACIFAAG
jgi:hypothetical protein